MTTEKNKKQKKEYPKVILSMTMYFKIEPDCYTLYYEKEDNKKIITLGYFTDIASLIKKAIKVKMSEKSTVMQFKEFIEEWKRLQKEFTELINI